MRRPTLPLVGPLLLAGLVSILALPRLPAATVKTDLDADISRDGRIDDNDPKDNGKVQNTPPGLPVMVGGLEKLILRCEPKSLAKGYVRLTVVSNPGEWERMKNPNWAAIPRRPEGGHIRIWKDAEKKELLLDSHDPAKQTVLWRLSYSFPMALVPFTLYAEGVSPSKEDGDVLLALLHSSSSRVNATSPTRDVLVVTVRKADVPRPVVTRDEPTRRGEVSADLIGDINRDGAVDPQNPADNGEVEDKPAGLPVTIGRVEKLALKVVPKSSTEGYVRFTVLSGAGEWEHLRDPERLPRPRRPAGGRIRIWEDAERTKVILDSHVEGSMMVVWKLSPDFPFERIPTMVYAEGLEPSKQDGDVALVLGYGLVETTDQPEMVQDILVATIKPGELAADLVGDVNGDGTIDPDDPADNGDAEGEPPGLTVPVGAVQELSLRCVPKSWTEGYVRFTVLAGAGEWEFLQDPHRLPRPRRPAGGHIRVWRDRERTQLVLDSHVHENMMVVWQLSEETTLDQVPRTVYVEGLAPSWKDGDVALVFGYDPGADTNGAEQCQDILAITVPPGELAADLVGDINRDGTIDPDDPADNGPVEDEPAGLKVGVGTLQKLSLHCVPKSMTEGYVRFTVLSGAGEWEHLRDPERLPRPRRPAGGHIRVWQDPQRTTLLLDSHVQGKMMVVWTLSEEFPFDLVPTTVYVEGMAASKEDGDVSLVLGCGEVAAPDKADLRQDILVATVAP
jgi:hypothetical protein